MNQPDWEGTKLYVLNRLAQELPSKLTYHGIHHTRDDVLPAAENLAARARDNKRINEADSLLLCVGALYHDLGYIERYLDNEDVAARIAEATLPRFDFEPGQIEIIKNIIMATRLSQSPTSYPEKLMRDADLDSLGRADFIETSHNLRTESIAYGQPYTITEWYEKQLKFLIDHSYFTEEAQSLRGSGKQQNIAELKRRLHKSPQNTGRAIIEYCLLACEQFIFSCQKCRACSAVSNMKHSALKGKKLWPK